MNVFVGKHIDPILNVRIEANPKFNKIRIVQNGIQTIVTTLFKKIEYNIANFLTDCLFIYDAKLQVLKRKKIKKRKRIPIRLSEEIKRKHGGICVICQKPFIETKLTVHHIQAACYGGLNQIENLLPICEQHHERLHEFADNLHNFFVKLKKISNNIPFLLKKFLNAISHYTKYFFEETGYRKILKVDKMNLLKI